MTSDIGDLLRAHAAPRRRVVDDHMFTVERGFAIPATFRLQVFAAHGARPVMVATQTTSEGPSLTNEAEYLSAAGARNSSSAPVQRGLFERWRVDL